MSPYKALITDLDGTAVPLGSDGADIPESTKRVIRTAQQQGYKIACATGRRWGITQPIIAGLGIKDLCVVEGGTRIIDPITRKTIWEKHLDTASLGAILDIFQREAEDGMLVTSQLTKVAVNTVQSVSDDSQFMYLLGVDPAKATIITNAINSQGIAVAHQTISWSGGGIIDIHVTHPEATKEHALRVWQDLSGVSHEETIGMGDSGNDIPLFLAAGLKVAVGDATDELKSLADYIAPNQSDKSLEHVIQHFLLDTH